MSHSPFVHLRVHSAYSLSEGAVKIPELAMLAKRLQMPAVGMTDSGNLFGALEFSATCAKQGVQPIIGCQIGVVATDSEGDRSQIRPDELILFVKDQKGYENLIKLVSHSFLQVSEVNFPQISYKELACHNEGLIALTGGPKGGVGRAILNGQNEAAENLLNLLREVFDDRLYVEIMRHKTTEEIRTEPTFLDLAEKMEIPIVATNEVFFSDPDMYEAHEALLCISEGKTLLDDSRRTSTAEHYFKSAEDMGQLFSDLPIAIDNTLVIAQRCSFMVEERSPMLPRAGGVTANGSENNLITDLCQQGRKARLENEGIPQARTQLYKERLSYELEVIESMGFAGYFLIVSEFINWAKSQDIAVGPGRGSGAGSAVAWVLGITDLDPIKFGLLFERFLNPERVSMPDFDIDFCQERRDEVIHHVQEQYGEKQVAQIITFGKLQARAVMRDVGRVLSMPYGQVDRLCKLIPNNPAAPVTLQEAINGEPRLVEARKEEQGVGRLINIALKLEGLFRHASTHAAGVVIGDRALDELVPLYRDPRSQMAITQFNMKDVEKAGLVKFDFLGLKTLTVLQKALRLVKRSGSEIELGTLALNDHLTYDLLSSGETVGVFQMESNGMREVLRKLKPDRFEDIIAVVALYRPGPMGNIPSYIERKHGREEVEYFHDSLEPILQETYGIMIYQEQVMQIAQQLSGFTLGEADLLRRAMGKKDQIEMDAQRQSFIDGAEKNGMAKVVAISTFDQVNAFAGYGFNKSHAAAYALVGYQTAFLKAHHPIEFMAALMTLEQGNTDKIGALRQELVRLGVELAPPNINLSSSEFSVESSKKADKQNKIRYALSAIKNVGVGAVDEIVSERNEKGPFKSLFDFAKRLGKIALNKRQFINLAKAGAFDCFNANRAQVVESTEILIRYGDWVAGQSGKGQESLFQDEQGLINHTPDLVVIEEWAPFERLREEADALGFYLSSHPLDAYGSLIEDLGVTSYNSLNEGGAVSENSSRKKITVVVQKRRERNSRRGRYAFLEVSDQTATFEVTVFSELLSRKRELLETGTALLMEVSVQRDTDSLRLIAQKIDLLDDKITFKNNILTIYIKEEMELAALKSVIDRDQGGKGQLLLVQRLDEKREVEVEIAGTYSTSPAFRAALKSVPGVIDVLER